MGSRPTHYRTDIKLGPMATLSDRALLTALRLVPRNLVSRGAGHLASVPWPRPLRPLLWKAFGRAVGVDFSEIRDPLPSFRSLQDFFVRRLKDDVRPVDPTPGALVSPCDGAWGQSGRVENGQLLQVKGRPYSLAELLGDVEDARVFEGGTFATLYLSPKDYHRFHTPCQTELRRVRYLPGGLWPVNRAGVELVDSLFARNERICAFFDVAEPGLSGRICLVAVGATMVGKIRLSFDALESNLFGGRRADRSYAPALPFERCQEWGRFHFGSTLVLVATPGTLRLDIEPRGSQLRLGRKIGELVGGQAGGT